MDYLPEVYKGFQQRFGTVAKAYDELATRCHEAGPLDARSRRLVKLAVAVGLSSEGGVRSHTRQALDEGISAGEICHTVLLALTTAGFPAMIAAMKWADEAIEKHGK